MPPLFTYRKRVELKKKNDIVQIVNLYFGYLKVPNNGIKKFVNPFIMCSGYFDSPFPIGIGSNCEIEILHLFSQNQSSAGNNYIWFFKFFKCNFLHH